MSVYTSINHQQLSHFLQDYSLGPLVDFQGIADGIDNTNYSFRTTQGQFILTVFETLKHNKLPPFLELLIYLSQNKFLCPQPLLNINHALLGQIQNKPAAVFYRLPGASIQYPNIEQCQNIGRTLGQLHQLTRSYSFARNNPRGAAWLQNFTFHCLPALDAAQHNLLLDELKFQAAHPIHSLPQGIIHADLFRDNVLFLNNKITGILDFYSTCQDALTLDLAIVINDWCINEAKVLEMQKLQALITGYQSMRPLSQIEILALPAMLRRAALRYWLSRLEHQSTPRQGEITVLKNPNDFLRILKYHRTNTVRLNLNDH